MDRDSDSVLVAASTVMGEGVSTLETMLVVGQEFHWYSNLYEDYVVLATGIPE